jgi:hypothetical protein
MAFMVKEYLSFLGEVWELVPNDLCSCVGVGRVGGAKVDLK